MRFFPFFLVFALVVATPSLVLPQEAPYNLDEIVVTASRIESRLKEAPANVTIVTAEDIEEQGAKTVAEALSNQPGVYTTSLLNNPKSGTIDIRGFGETAGQNVLVLVDGRRINGPDMAGGDLSQVPVESIERIEVYRGPASVLYGDNAIGGVVNIITKKGQGPPKLVLEAMAGSYNLFTPSLSISGGSSTYSYYTFLSAYDTDGYRHNNYFNGRDVLGNFTFSPLPGLDLRLSAGHHKDDYGQPGALTFDQITSGVYGRKDSANPNDFSRTEDNFVEFGPDIRIGRTIVFSLIGSYRDRHTSSRSEFVGFSWDTKRTLITKGFTPKMVMNNEFGHVKNTFILGFDYYDFPMDSTDSSAGAQTKTDVEKTEYGYYANDQLSIAGKLLLDFGYRIAKARYDFDYRDPSGMTANASGIVHQEKDAFRASANYLFKNGNVFASYSKGFRFAATDEFFNIFATPPISPIKPQVAYELDIGIRWNPLRWIGGSVTVFDNKTDNEIYYDPTTWSNGNYGRTGRKGVEATASLLLADKVKWDLNYTYLKPVFDGGIYDGNEIPFVPRNKFSSKVTYFHGDFTFSLLALYIGNRYGISDQANVQPKTPGFTTFDVNLRYRFKNLVAFFTVKNLTGKRYDEFYGWSSYSNVLYSYPAAERQFLLGMKYIFGG